MTDGRIVAGDKDLGVGFCLTDRIVATAAHVVRDRAAPELAFVTAAGLRVPVEWVRCEPAIDSALLRVTESLAIVPPLAHATLNARWRVTARPQGAAVQLTGEVTAVDHLVTNAAGHEMTVLQLAVVQELKDYQGYSGSAVTVDDAVVGVLVEQVPERAVAGAALRPLASNVLYAVPVDRVVRRFGLGAPVLRPEPPSPVRRLLDTAYFDLDALKTAILHAKAATDDRLLAFGVPDADLKVITNLCAWLPPYLGEVARKDLLALRPEILSPERAVSYVTRYFADLDRCSVVCPVLVDGVPTDLVADFWDRVRATYRRRKRWLVLFFAGLPGDACPAGVTALPRPVFAHRDVATWTAHVVSYRHWPASLAEVWAEHIVAESSVADRLDVRITYEVLEDYIKRVQLDPAELLDHLEELETGC